MAKDFFSDLIVKFGDLGGSAIETSGGALASIGQLTTAAFTAISGALVASTFAYEKTEKSLNSLNQSLINQGIYTKQISKDYQDLAAQYSAKTQFSKSEIMQAQSRVQMYVGQHKVTEPMVKAILNLAQVTGKDLDAAAQAVGKSIGTNENALSRFGIRIDENVTQTIRTEEVLTQLQLKFGGQAEAANHGLGSVNKMAGALTKVAASFGKMIAPMIEMLAKSMIDLSANLQEDHNVINGFVSIANLMLKTTVLLKAVLESSAKLIADILSTTFSSGSALIEGQFKKSFMILEEGTERLSRIITVGYDSAFNNIAEINSLIKSDEQSRREQKLKIINQSAQDKIREQRFELEAYDSILKARDREEINRLLLFENIKSNQHLKDLNEVIYREQGQTERLKAELEKKKFLNQQVYDMEVRRTFLLSELHVNSAHNQFDQLERVLSSYQEFQRSKNSELITLGKAAAIVAMVISGYRAVTVTYAWCAKIPFIGYLIAPVMAGLVSIWYLEQISHIAGASLDDPGEIGLGISFNKIGDAIVETIKSSPWVFAFLITDIGRKMWASFDDWKAQEDAKAPDQRNPEPGTEPERPYGSGGFEGILKDMIVGGIQVLGSIIGGVIGWIGGLFGEGGLVTGPEEQRDILPLAGLALGANVNVTVMGGLSGTESEARKLASLIYQEMSRAQGGMS